MEISGQRKGVSLSRRAIADLPTSVAESADELIIPIVITTEAPCVDWIPNPKVAQMTPAEFERCNISDIECDVVLLTSGMDYSRTFRMPLLDSHDRWSVHNILGRIDNVRAEDGKIVGDAVFMEQYRDIARGIRKGFYGQFSAGFSVRHYEITERPGQRPLAVATDWVLQETSAVPIGADANATARGQRGQGDRLYPFPTFSVRADSGATPTTTQENPMDLETLVANAEAALKAVADATDDGASDDVVARATKLRAFGMDDGTGTEKKPEDEGARAAEDDALTAEEDKKNADLEASAQRSGLDGFVRSLREVNAKPGEIRAALKTELLKRGAQETAKEAAKPIRQQEQVMQRSEAERIRARYDKFNNPTRN